MKCKECGEIFESHGNARYCPEKNTIKNFCYTKAKLGRQKLRLKDEKLDIAEYARIIGYLDGLMSGKQQIVIPIESLPSNFFKNKKVKKSIIDGSEIYKMENYQVAKFTTERGDQIQLTKLNNPDEFSIYRTL